MKKEMNYVGLIFPARKVRFELTVTGLEAVGLTINRLSQDQLEVSTSGIAASSSLVDVAGNAPTS